MSTTAWISITALSPLSLKTSKLKPLNNMSSSSMEAEMRTALSEVGVNVSKDILNKCVNIAKNRNISPMQLATTWETHSLNHQIDQLTPQTFKSFQTALLSSTKNSSSSYNNGIVSPTPMKRGAVTNRPAMAKRTNPNANTVSPRVKRKVDFDTQLEHVVANDGQVHSPLAKKNATSTSSPEASSNSSAIVTPSRKSVRVEEPNAYGNRSNAGQVVVTYNPKNLNQILNPSPVDITLPFGSVEELKGMTDKDHSSALNSHLTSFQKEFCQQERNKQLQKGEISNENEFPYEFIGVPHSEAQFNVGRICNEAHEGKMNKTTILLEGSRVGSNGARINLDMRQIDDYTLFPGQIVGVKGVNTSGRKMIVDELIQGLDTSFIKNKTNELVLEAESITTTNTGMKIVSVVGPYTSGQDLEYQPLVDLLSFVSKEKPSIVIMMGPFVDMRQELLKNEDEVIVQFDEEDPDTKRHVNYETLFAAKISQELECLYEEIPDLATKFILVPSLDDAISEPIYPQPPVKDSLPNGGKALFSIPETQDFPFGSLCLGPVETAGRDNVLDEPGKRRVHLVSNPATIKINDITIGLTSTDALLHLSNETLSQGLPPNTRMSRLAEHFIRQQSYYPLFPPSSSAIEEMSLDVTLRSKFSMPVQPDILILPSKLATFVKDVADGTTVVNPGYLVKGNKGGTFSVIDVHPSRETDVHVNGDNVGTSDLKERIRVEIRRI